jgi:phage terminase small subunit
MQQNGIKPKIIEKIVEVEKVVEKIVEVEKVVEKIVEVEKVVEKIVEVEKVVEKIVEVEKVVEKPIETEKVVEVIKTEIKTIVVDALPIDKTKFKTYTCKTLDSGSIEITKKCRNNLNKFLENNSESRKFEVIGLVDKAEFSLMKTLEDVYGKKRVGNLTLYTQIGLSRQRVIEAAWLVKKQLGSYAKINAVNYTATSKNKRGFVIRAYK